MKSALLVVACLLALPPLLVADPVEPDARRAQFSSAYKALTSGRTAAAKKAIAGLEEYPLYPYFRYFELDRTLHKASPNDVREFLDRYGDSLLADRLRSAWLRRLAKKEQWTAYLADYREQTDINLQCARLSAAIATQADEDIVAAATKLWLVGKSQPQACDRAFKYLSDQHGITDELRVQRFHLALENNKTSLARYLARDLSTKELAFAATSWLLAHENPNAALNSAALASNTQTNREIIAHAVSRLARTNVDRAAARWQDLATKYEFAQADHGKVARHIALAAASDDHPQRIHYLDQVPQAFVDDKVEKYRIREGIKMRAWAELARWTAQAPHGGANDLRWRYWHARASEQNGRSEEANLVFRELARERDYYGFLSADRLGIEYQMNHHPTDPSAGEIDALANRPGLIRARELFAIGLPYKARREWGFEIGQLSTRELEVAAYLANQWGWLDRAIAALGMAKSYDDLDIRFPLRHEDLVRKYAEKRALPLAVIYSIIRTESAFTDDARSPAGALGLMQVMPATGRDTARRIGTKLNKARDLLQPKTNIMIGSAYLRQVLARFEGSFSLAAAAYNAGPHRVKSWLPKSGCVAADIWVDTIPFTETRRYVRRASFYATIYQWRLKEEIDRITSRLSDVNASGKIQQC